jgi:3-dehydroquinate dehydratase/shikimate dehydrogenase
MTRLTVSITVNALDQALADTALAAERGADMVEYRIDELLIPFGQITELVAESPLPCIITCRGTAEGGLFDGDEQGRIDAYRHAAAGQPAYIDIELSAYETSPVLRQAIRDLVADPNGPGLILSTHDFERRPFDLFQKIETMAADPACRVIKAAWHARSLRDNLEAFELIAAQHKPTIALCMGEFGLPSRVLAKKFGALLTFCGLDDATTTAPGQVGVATMKSLYRWDAIQADTQVFGVIGWPVAHSMSPPIHNTGFAKQEVNAVYLPMPIPPEYEHFKATVGTWLDCEPLNFRGASVTIPHKENLIRYVNEVGGEVEPLSARIGAANTLTVQDDDTLYASNSDYAAAMDSVCDAMGIGREGLAGRRVAVIGAGGVARAIVAAFVEYGATVVIYNRTIERAQQLAEEFGEGHAGKVVATPLANLAKSCCEVYINCTSVGMHPHEDDTPMPDAPDCLGPDTVVFDTIYNPIETRLLREAGAAGCRTINGVDMFVRQGAAQFERWTGQTSPTDAFEQAMLTHLGLEK